MSRLLLVIAVTLLSIGCGGEIGPGDVTPSDACTYCRMHVSDPHFAGQIGAPGEETMFFDDIGCLANWLKEHEAPSEAIAWVADHRTGRWVQAVEAVYTKAQSISTPMGSNIIAHIDTTSRDADRDAINGETLTVAAVFGSARVPGGDHAR